MYRKPINRVKEIIDFKNISISAFEKKTGLSNNSIQIAIKRESNLKDETLNNILNTFTDISAEWLLTGEGDMLKSDVVNEVRESKSPSKSNPNPTTTNDYLLKTIQNLEYTIEIQKKLIEKLESQVKST